MTDDLNWMSRFCASDKPNLAQPFFPIEDTVGIQWTCASDGKILVAVAEISDYRPCKSESIVESAKSLLSDRGTNERSVSFPLFSAWCGEPEWPKDADCDFCKGLKTVSCDVCGGNTRGEMVACKTCGQEHRCRCQRCKDGTVKCPDCEGSGKTTNHVPRRLGRVGGVIVNREYLARVFQFVAGGTKEERIALLFADKAIELNIAEQGPKGAEPDRLVLRAACWKVILMGFRQADETGIPRYEMATRDVETEA